MAVQSRVYIFCFLTSTTTNTGKSHSKTNHSIFTGYLQHQIQKVSTHYNIKKLTILFQWSYHKQKRGQVQGGVRARGPASKWGPMSKASKRAGGAGIHVAAPTTAVPTTGVGAAGAEAGGSSSGGSSGGGGGSGSGGWTPPLTLSLPKPCPLPP